MAGRIEFLRKEIDQLRKERAASIKSVEVVSKSTLSRLRVEERFGNSPYSAELREIERLSDDITEKTGVLVALEIDLLDRHSKSLNRWTKVLVAFTVVLGILTAVLVWRTYF